MIVAVVTVVAEDEVEPTALLVVGATQEKVDALCDDLLIRLHAQGNYLVEVHTGLQPIVEPEDVADAAAGFEDGDDSPPVH